eukprot:gene4046-14127_t
MSAMGGTTSYGSPINNFGRQPHLQQGNWTGSPRGAGGAAQEMASSSPPATNKSLKFLPIEENVQKIAVERSLASLSSGSSSYSPSLKPNSKRTMSCCQVVLNDRPGTGSPRVAGVKSIQFADAPTIVQFTSLARGSDRGTKFAPIEGSLPEISVERSATSLLASMATESSSYTPSLKRAPQKTVSCGMLSLPGGDLPPSTLTLAAAAHT